MLGMMMIRLHYASSVMPTGRRARSFDEFDYDITPTRAPQRLRGIGGFRDEMMPCRAKESLASFERRGAEERRFADDQHIDAASRRQRGCRKRVGRADTDAYDARCADDEATTSAPRGHDASAIISDIRPAYFDECDVVRADWLMPRSNCAIYTLQRAMVTISATHAAHAGRRRHSREELADKPRRPRRHA
jgi:hypothetical protein